MIVLVECFHDFALAKALGVRRQAIRHESGKGNVLNRLSKAQAEAVGLLDEDPHGGNPPAQLANYEEKDRTGGLRLLVHRQDPSKHVIEISPRLEEWLVARARTCNIDLATHRLPGTAREMHDNPRCDLKPGFQPFIQELLQIDAEMKTLRRWLQG